jgi:hypothetical protein
VSAEWKTGSNLAEPGGAGSQSLAAVHCVTSSWLFHWNLRTLQVCVCQVRKLVYVPPLIDMNTSRPSESGVW